MEHDQLVAFCGSISYSILNFAIERSTSRADARTSTEKEIVVLKTRVAELSTAARALWRRESIQKLQEQLPVTYYFFDVFIVTA